MRVALVAGPDPGHAYNVLGLGAVLAARGADVTIATGTQHRAATEGAGLRFVELPLPAPTAGDRGMGHLIWGRVAEMAPPLADLLRPTSWCRTCSPAPARSPPSSWACRGWSCRPTSDMAHAV